MKCSAINVTNIGCTHGEIHRKNDIEKLEHYRYDRIPSNIKNKHQKIGFLVVTILFDRPSTAKITYAKRREQIWPPFSFLLLLLFLFLFYLFIYLTTLEDVPLLTTSQNILDSLNSARQFCLRCSQRRVPTGCFLGDLQLPAAAFAGTLLRWLLCATTGYTVR